MPPCGGSLRNESSKNDPAQARAAAAYEVMTFREIQHGSEAYLAEKGFPSERDFSRLAMAQS